MAKKSSGHQGPPAGLVDDSADDGDQHVTEDSELEVLDDGGDAEIDEEELDGGAEDELSTSVGEIEGSEGESDESDAVSEEESDAEPDAASPTRPEFLPDVVDWDSLPLDQKLLIQDTYSKGRAAEAATISAEDRAVLDRMKALETETSDQPAARPQKLTAPQVELPEEYKDDPGMSVFSKQVNDALKQQTDLNNALVGEIYNQRDTISNLSGSYTQTTQQQMWQQFTTIHPEAADESVIAEMTEQMKLLNPGMPAQQQWEVALKMTGRSKPEPKGEDIEQKTRRGRAVRAASAASGRSGRRTTGQVETPESVTAGMSFEDVYRRESKNGTLPSQV
jgi:hypothetical protein